VHYEEWNGNTFDYNVNKQTTHQCFSAVHQLSKLFLHRGRRFGSRDNIFLVGEYLRGDLDSSDTLTLTPSCLPTTPHQCSKTCQGGKQTRNVKCVVPRMGAAMPDSACPARPITERPCNEGVVCGKELDYMYVRTYV